MTLEQLRVFLEVAEQLHMTRAAERLHLTQSAVSASVAALEASCGVRLFHRVGRRIELTESGATFIPEARAILERVAQAEQVLGDMSALTRGSLSLFASQTIAGYWLGPVLARFHARHPHVALKVAVGNTAQAVASVLGGHSDLGFVEGEANAPLLVKTSVPGDRLVLVVGRQHAWAGLRELSPERLPDSDWVLRESGSGTRDLFEASCRGHGVDPALLTVALELPSNEAVVSAVMAGAGATVISGLAAAAGLASGALVRLPLRFPERRFLILRHAERYRSRAEAALLDLVHGRA